MQQIIFEYTTKYGVFRDAIYLPEDHNLTDQDIDALKQERLDQWFKAIEEIPQENINA